MRTLEINIYQFNELSEQAKKRAIEKHLDINVNYNWWEFTYEDAEQIGLKITSFDLDRNRHAEGKFIWDAHECAKEIILQHDGNSETYEEAKNYLSDYDSLVEFYSNGIEKNIVSEENEYEFDQVADELKNEFLESILECYSIMLQNESEHLMSEEAIIETIEANEYEFDFEGNRM
jgi:hypothetical protein